MDISELFFPACATDKPCVRLYFAKLFFDPRVYTCLDAQMTQIALQSNFEDALSFLFLKTMMPFSDLQTLMLSWTPQSLKDTDHNKLYQIMSHFSPCSLVTVLLQTGSLDVFI